ncbi:hypothetical protein ACFDAA_15195 [Enterococcus casseliflavus]|uniref:YobI family P-loop NTPase n=2 Tax=Enterococcus casseliflavus TaxID=37734 RepID=UPI0039A5EC88
MGSSKLEDAENSEPEEVEEKTIDVEFEHLTPNDSMDLTAYKEALDYGIKNRMTNIALSGPYGAGKSSVLEAYKKNHTDKKFMHISLSHFEGSKEIDTKILEGKIINQLLHQIEFKKIPRTIFKAKENQSKFKMIFATSIVFLFITSGIITFQFSKWKKYYTSFFSSEKFASWFTGNTFHLISLLVFTSILVFLIYNFINLQVNQQVMKKIILKGNEIEIFKDSHESYFDKFMNDVIYLFINSGKDIIVFEDLDRFDNATIYEKLHEINTLVNRRLVLKNKKKLTFIYLIKDDTFKSKDRTKFFDLLIPVVPVVDSSNSFDQLLSIFERNKVKKDFNINIIRKISFYIDDMRLLKNINNEYIIYKSRLRSISLDCNKLIAMITYKNLFPEDFSLFQSGVGYINSVIKSKERILSKEIQKLSDEIELLNSSINIAKKEHLNDIDELDALYLKLDNDGYFSVEDKKEDEFTTRKDFIRAIKDNNFNIIKYTPRSGSYRLEWHRSEINISGKFKELTNNDEYRLRLEAINNKRIIDMNQNKIINLEIEKKNRMNSSLSEILSNINNNFFIDTNYFSEEFHYLFKSQYFPLIVFLLREGLIDENYGDYITYFYENSLKKDDKEFLRSAYDRNPKELNYKLQNSNQIVTNLTPGDITTYDIKNIDLAAYLVSIYPENNLYLKSVIDVMKSCEDNSYILGLFEKIKNSGDVEKFTNISNDFWPTIFADIISKSDKNDDILEFLYVISSFAKIQFLKVNNEDNLLTNYISERRFIHPLILSKEQQEVLLEKFKKIGIKFHDLKKSNADIDSLKAVINSRMIDISESNLEQILQIYDIKYSRDEFKYSNITLFYENNPDNIYEYLAKEKINEYIRVYLKFGMETLKENSNVFVEILNSEKLNKELGFELIKKTNLANQIEDLKYVINTDYWNSLLIAEHIKIDERNIVSYYKEADNDFSEQLVTAINKTTVKITFSKDNLSDKTREELWETIVHNNQLDNRQYISMLKSLGFYWRNGFKLSVSSLKIKQLIYAKIIRNTKKNLNEILNNHKVNLVDFVQVDIGNFCNIFIDEDIYQFSVIKDLLMEKELVDSKKKRIVDISKQDISIQNLNVSYRIQKYILENKFEDNDFSYIIEEYSKFNNLVKSTIYIKAMSNIERIVQEKVSINIELLLEMLSDEQISERKILFSYYIQLLDDKDVIKYVRSLNFPEEFILVLKKRRPKFENSSINKRILEDYRRRDWITKIYDRGNYIKVQGRMVLK